MGLWVEHLYVPFTSVLGFPHNIIAGSKGKYSEREHQCRSSITFYWGCGGGEALLRYHSRTIKGTHCKHIEYFSKSVPLAFM